MAGALLDYKVFTGLCPDERCQTKLYFPAHKTVIECPNCGQTHSQNKIKVIEEVTDGEEAITQVLKSIVWDAKMPKKGSDSVKVHGLSNFHCKLLSPLFTRYGMDREGKPKLLGELGHGETADCGRLLCHRAFLILPEHIDIMGYGRDRSGSVEYLKGLLEIIKDYHDGEERLLPIHADGDGHCLVHALSRATTGREIFWHALRDNLVNHLEKNLNTYQIMFQDFIDKDDWPIIIEEADPYHVTPDGFNVGLGNIHIFALANVLKRPIVLLDSLEGINNVADYTAIFVPALVEASECRGNMPLCVAWSGSGHNHFIPLIGVAGKPLPSIPKPLIPNIWGIDKTQGEKYLNFNNDGSLSVAGGKPLQKGYLLRLVSAMEVIFLEKHGIAARLVADMHLYVYQRVGFVGLHPDVAIEKTKEAVRKNQIFRCLMCNALNLASVDDESFRPGGYLFEVMRDCHGKPRPDIVYNFPMDHVQCKYDDEKKCLVLHQFSCHWCKVLRVRRVDHRGNTIYQNADPTTTPAEILGQCCGFKHHWDGHEYENIPKQFMLNITLQGKTIEEKVTWFFGDSNPLFNSDGEKISNDIAIKYFGTDDPDYVHHVNKIRSAIKSNIVSYGLADDTFSAFDDVKNETDEMSEYSKHVNPRRESSLSRNMTKDCENVNKTLTVNLDNKPSTSKSITTKRGVNGDSKLATPSLSLNVTTEKPTSSSLPSSSSKSNTVKVRISTSDGRQETLMVDVNLDYIGLQNTVQKHFSLLPSRQVLKHGFPPRQLKAGEGKMPLGLRNGDRITVEIKEEKITREDVVSEKISNNKDSLLKTGPHKTSDNSLDTLRTFVDLLRASKIIQSERRTPLSSASVDTALTAVSKMAEMMGKNEWEYAIDHPELFHPGGAFYEQFARDIGLLHEKHCTLPLLPGQVFKYDGIADCVQLCIDPDGHYNIGPGIMDTIKQIEISRAQSAASRIKQEQSDELKPMDSQPEETLGRAAQSSDVLVESDDNTVLVEDMQTDNVGSDKDIKDDTVRTNQPKFDDIVNEMTSTDSERAIFKESKIGPGFTTLGSEPSEINPEEAEAMRKQLLKILEIKKQNDIND